MKNKVEEKFIEFYESWFSELEQYLHQLLVVNTKNITEMEQRELISKLTTHHKAYYTTKWAAIGEDVLAFFGPVWLNPLEKTCFWLTGWKPSTAFCMVDRLRKSWRSAVLVESQVKKLEELRHKMRLEEDKVEREMERYQVGIADRKMVELGRLGCHIAGDRVGPKPSPIWFQAFVFSGPALGGDGERESREAGMVERVEVLVEAAVKGLATGLERMVKAADCVRLKTLKGILDILAPPQCVEFLAAAAAFQLHLRRSGIQTHINTLTYYSSSAAT